MGDGGKYRYRRHSVFTANLYSKEIIEVKNTPHHQKVQFNNLNGGVERWFEPMEDSVINSDSFVFLIKHSLSVFNEVEKKGTIEKGNWYIESHQFRIKAKDDKDGLPTPEGVHNDGVSYVFMMIVDRVNIKGGETGIYKNNKELTVSHVLDKGYLAYIIDSKVMHGVSPISIKNKYEDAYRDVLVLTFKKVI